MDRVEILEEEGRKARQWGEGSSTSVCYQYKHLFSFSCALLTFNHSYDGHIEALFKMFDTNIDAQVAQWVKYFADFEVEYFTNAASVAPRV